MRLEIHDLDVLLKDNSMEDYNDPFKNFTLAARLVIVLHMAGAAGLVYLTLKGFFFHAAPGRYPVFILIRPPIIICAVSCAITLYILPLVGVKLTKKETETKLEKEERVEKKDGLD